MGELSKGSGISSIRGGDFELGASGVSAAASSDIVVEDITPLALMPLEDDLGLVLGTGTATFTRSTIKTFDDRNDGLVKTAAIDVAAFEQNGYFGEGASTNLLLRSEEFDNATWTKAQVTISADDTAAPDDAVTADKVIESTATSSHEVRDTVTLSASLDYTFSVFAKPAGRDFIRLVIRNKDGVDSGAWFNISTGVVGTTDSGITADIKSAANGFFRCSITRDSGTGGSQPFVFMLLADADNSIVYTGDGSSGLFLWGAQLEQLSFASSYIKTVASTVTKTDDDLDIPSTNIPAPTADYTVSMEVDALGFDSSLSQVLFNVAGETSRRIAWNTTTGAIEATHGAVTSVSTSTFSAGDRVKISFAVDATNQTLFINGVQEDQDVKGTVTGTATAVNIGHQAGVNQAFSHIKPLRIDNVALTAAQAGAL